jgi:signal transduction histidine kinase
VGGRQRLASDVEIALFRIVQETINNVLKHADATCVSVVLERRSTFTRLIVEDDGKGFKTRPTGSEKPLQSPQSLGLSGIQERLALIGGHMTIETGLEKGTTLFIVVPSV